MNWLQKIAVGYLGGGDSEWMGFWADPTGNTYKVKDTHQAWVYENKDNLNENYGIDIDTWYMGRLEEEEGKLYEHYLAEVIRDTAYELEIDESQVELPDEKTEEIQTWASEGADGQINDGVEMVDLLITKGWLRLSCKWSRLHVEGNAEMPAFLSRAEDALTKCRPKIWSVPSYHIIINDQEIYSRDLQNAGNLAEAMAGETRRDGLALHQR